MALLYVVEGDRAVDADGGVWNLVGDRRWELDDRSRLGVPRLTVIAGGGEDDRIRRRPISPPRTAHAGG